MTGIGVTMASAALAQPHRGGMMMGMGGDMGTIHALFDAREKITRTVKNLPDGVDTVTESDDEKVRKMIREHVGAMYQRLAKKQPIRMWDPLFAELFRNADKIKFTMTNTEKGIRVVETSADPRVAKMLIAHAEGVTEFLKEGMAAMHKSHPVPE
jgi:hypothetical protein